jgi:uncharacterized protein (DUF305 family)
MTSARRALQALAAAGVLLFAGCGDDESAGTASRSAGANPTDRAFVAEMVPHHEAAVQMARIATTRAESPFVKKLAADIIRTQKDEIATLRREVAALAEQGIGAGSLGLDDAAMGMDHDASMLERAKPFDAAFLRMMVPHHQGALKMSEIELDKGGDPELKALAREIIDGQTREIAQMRAHMNGGSRDDEDEMHEDNHEAAPGY